MKADWVAIKSEYVTTRASMRALAEKYGVPVDTIKKKAAADKWTEERTKLAPKVHQKIVQEVVRKTAAEEANRIVRLLDIGDKLAERLDLAADQLDRMTLRHKRKSKEVVYGDPDAKGKPTREIINEIEHVSVVEAPIDRQGLQQLSTTLKNLHAVMLPEKGDQGGAGSLSVNFEGAMKEAAE